MSLRRTRDDSVDINQIDANVRLGNPNIDYNRHLERPPPRKPVLHAFMEARKKIIEEKGDYLGKQFDEGKNLSHAIHFIIHSLYSFVEGFVTRLSTKFS